MKPLGKVQKIWSRNLAYAIGLIATDGNLSSDGRHVNFTSKDYQLASAFKTCLNIDNRIGKKARGGDMEKKYFVVQFGDTLFYRFLIEIGLTPNKSKTIGLLKIPTEYFFDFFRGCIDGDGSIQISKHPESQYPQLRVRLCSASFIFLEWIHSEIKNLGLRGFILQGPRVYQLTFAKADSIQLLNWMYYPGFQYCLERKYRVAQPFLRA